jgi:hypothetical protein
MYKHARGFEGSRPAGPRKKTRKKSGKLKLNAARKRLAAEDKRREVRLEERRRQFRANRRHDEKKAKVGGG